MMTIERSCPNCETEIEFDQWCEDFECPQCGAKLRHEHDCSYDEESGDEWCDDWLEVVQ